MILIIDMNAKKDSLGSNEFVNPIIRAVNRADECKAVHYLDVGKDDIIDCNKIILSGTPLIDNDYLNHLDKFAWLKEVNKPVLGICAGMQIIALVFCSELMKCQEIGMKKIIVKKKNLLFSEDFEAYELHKQSVKPSKSFIILAKSGKCIQAIKHKGKDIYGVLFHAEVRNQDIIQGFLRITP
jgi:GMP synthase-like glutamine amidotransferase